jgi:hypothetical protein
MARKTASLSAPGTPKKDQVNSVCVNPDSTNKEDPTHQPVRAELYGSQARQHGHKSYDYEKRWVERGKLLLEALTLGAVVFYGVVAYRQWRAMLVGNEDATKALQITQRAYVNVASVRLGQPFVVGNVLDAIVDYRNSGLTPAKELWVATTSGVSGEPISFFDRGQSPTAPAWCETIPNGEVLPPGITRHKNTNIGISTGKPIPPAFYERITTATYAAVKKGMQSWFIETSISYRDQFGHCHWTEEPFRYNPETR